MSSNSPYFFIFDDQSGTYALSVIQQVTANLKAGLIAYGEPSTFTLLGTDGKTYTFTNNTVPNPNPPPNPNPNPPNPDPNNNTPFTPINNPIIPPVVNPTWNMDGTNPPNSLSNPSQPLDFTLYLIWGSIFYCTYIKYGKRLILK